MINIVRIDYKAGTFGAASGANLGLDALIYCTYLVSRSLGRNFIQSKNSSLSRSEVLAYIVLKKIQ